MDVASPRDGEPFDWQENDLRVANEHYSSNEAEGFCACTANLCYSIAYTLRGGLRESDIDALQRRQKAEQWSNVFASDGGTSEPHLSSVASENLDAFDRMELVAFDFDESSALSPGGQSTPPTSARPEQQHHAAARWTSHTRQAPHEPSARAMNLNPAEESLAPSGALPRPPLQDHRIAPPPAAERDLGATAELA